MSYKSIFIVKVSVLCNEIIMLKVLKLINFVSVFFQLNDAKRILAGTIVLNLLDIDCDLAQCHRRLSN
jgi:hypothetical protein